MYAKYILGMFLVPMLYHGFTYLFAGKKNTEFWHFMLVFFQTGLDFANLCPS
jgi:hypothetical protein